MKEKINQINKQVSDSISEAVKAVERIFSKTSERLNPILYQEKVGADLVSVLTAFVKGNLEFQFCKTKRNHKNGGSRNIRRLKSGN